MAAVLLACLACTDAWARTDAPDIARSSRQLLQGALLALHVRTVAFVQGWCMSGAHVAPADTFLLPKHGKSHVVILIGTHLGQSKKPVK